MHFRAITRIVGLLVILFSGTMIVPGLVALIYRDGAGRAFTQTFFVALAIGSMLWWPNRKQKRRTEISRRVSDRGAVLDRAGERGAFALYLLRTAEPDGDGCLLRVIFRPDDDRGDHSGGAGLASARYPLYRQMLQWFGGMGIIVLAVAILPILGVGGDAALPRGNARPAEG